MRASARPIRVLSAFLLLVVANIYVFATVPVSPAANASDSNGRTLLGKLITKSNRPVIVNGGEAITGATIVSGTRLITPAAAGAIVQLDNIGTVSIAPNSSVALSFDAKAVTVDVMSGYASVATVEGVKGTVTGLPTSGGNGAPAPATVHSAQTWGIAGVAVGSAAFIWAIIAWNRANNARDSAAAANAAAASLASQLAALRTCLAGQTVSPAKLCTSF